MHYSAFFTALSLLASSVAGLPVRRTDSNATVANAANLLVLKFANVLEQLETEFYTQALQKFQTSDFTTAGFSDASVPIQQFTNIMSDESTHTTVLEAAIQSLGDSAVSGCSFDFSSVLTDVATMAPVARLVENVGVGAYLGAAHLITDPVILTDAASIVTVEARHQTILNVLNGGTAIPAAFDLPLLPQEVLAIAGSFISGCSVGIDALPSLKVTNTGSINAGTCLQFSFDAQSSISDTSTLSCQMLAGGMPFSLSLPFDNCVVPEGLVGPVAIYVTNDTQPLANNARDRFTGNIVAGPTMAFLDNSTESLSSLAKSGSVSNSGSTDTASTSISTATISPEEASSIVASASATATGADASATAASDNSIPPTANTTTGNSPDGAISVNGWTLVPPSSPSSA
ncbi:uncharacterized protein FOMMEDRAFT_110235 [Fomitiporia mediterranea MF3/22]|uniref:uncharacterized protein n=1 Tax=Fomitiporia mediterranea (strain MF3/22) TaxID=694068 RepID=UPI000440746F|nr:uncharacterized protein FOMMEDRAFT_110235 [Fomitiporia mediterranea MF3/22]EJD00858.1 hypothetical protein FOMMEDRAFT_110235 [Fomitiporia mediterranea MF3/22]